MTDPDASVRIDVERVRSCSWIPARVSVSGWVYDLRDGAVRAAVPAGPVGALRTGVDA